ncbi:MAG: VRR-NUC domain-containing protein [Pseudomonadota bacterium]
MPQVELPPKYYLDHFESLLAFIVSKCSPLLSANEAEFIDCFRALPEDARCLFVRLLNRKGIYFRANRLSYSEIQTLPNALETLINTGFVYLVSEVATPTPILNLFTRKELGQFAHQQQLQPPPHLKKNELIIWLASHLNFSDWLAWLNENDPVIEHGFKPETDILRLMFFGSTHHDMTTFVVSDLGHSRFESFDSSQLTSAFTERRILEEKYAIVRAGQRFRLLESLIPPTQLVEWFKAWLPTAEQTFEPTIQNSFDRLVLQVARSLERKNESSMALDIYQKTKSPPSRERRTRLLHKCGEDEAALTLCGDILDMPYTPEERLFAEDFESRLLKRRQKATTLYLKQAECLAVEDSAELSIELCVLKHYLTLGYQGFFSENNVWRSLLGLLCWPLIFDTSNGALHHPFQRAPSNWANYLSSREDEVTQQLKLLDERTLFTTYIEAIYAEKYGTHNPLVVWYEELPAHLLAFYQCMTPVQLKAVLIRIANDPTIYGQGMPDLFIWREDDEYNFIEVKSPNDSLSAKQLDWLRFFERHDVNAKVIRTQSTSENA